MTPEERQESIEVLRKSIGLANKHGQTLLDDSDGVVAVASTSAAIIFSSFCSAAGMSMHEAVDLFMSVHKQTAIMVKERQQ
jgi:hypothetical protein